MSTDWNMPRRAEACTSCGRRFDAGEVFHVFLHQTQAAYERRDCCDQCRSAALPDAVASWRTRRPAPRSRQAAPFDRAAFYRFFERLEEARDERQAQLRFVLALLLWRKKVLRLERSLAVDEHEHWEFTTAGSDAVHRVARPDLDEAQLEGLSRQLEQLLEDPPVEPDDVPAALDEEAGDA